MKIRPGSSKAYSIMWWPEDLPASKLSIKDMPEQFIIVDPETGETGRIADWKQRAMLIHEIQQHEAAKKNHGDGSAQAFLALPRLSKYNVELLGSPAQVLNTVRVAVQKLLGDAADEAEFLANLIGPQNAARIAMKLIHGQSISLSEVAGAAFEFVLGQVAAAAVGKVFNRLYKVAKAKYFNAFKDVVTNSRTLTALTNKYAKFKDIAAAGLSRSKIRNLLREAQELVGDQGMYLEMKKVTSGFHGLIQAHHIFPEQLIDELFRGETREKLGKIMWSIVLDRETHSAITTALKRAIKNHLDLLRRFKHDPKRLRKILKDIIREAYGDAHEELRKMAEALIDNLPLDCIV